MANLPSEWSDWAETTTWTQPSAPVVQVWDGTQLIDAASVQVWDGTTLTTVDISVAG